MQLLLIGTPALLLFSFLSHPLGEKFDFIQQPTTVPSNKFPGLRRILALRATKKLSPEKLLGPFYSIGDNGFLDRMSGGDTIPSPINIHTCLDQKFDRRL